MNNLEKTVLIIGASGNLGSELFKINSKFLNPSKKNLNITKISDIKKYLKNKKIDIIINCAAITDTVMCEKNIKEAVMINVIGAANLTMLQDQFDFKIVHISTDYVFDGKKGSYKNLDPINPISNYSKSKAAAELIVRMNRKNLIIRTSFFPLEFRHPAAFVDQYTTKDFVDIIAPMIYKESISDKTGIIHIGTEKDSVYNKVKKRYPNIKKMSRKDIKSVYIPYDTSLE